VSSLTTLEASVAIGGGRGVVSHGCTRGSVLAVLRKSGALHGLTRVLHLLVLLIGVLVLVLAEVDILTSIAERCSLRGVQNRGVSCCWTAPVSHTCSSARPSPCKHVPP
jgi:hypothetical protein